MSLVAGATAVWSFSITNAGPDDAVNVRNSETMRGGVALISSTAAICSVENQIIGCYVPTIPAGVTVPVTLTVRLDPGIPAGTVIQNTARITSDMDDPNIDNNTYGPVSAPPVTTQADLSWTLTAQPPVDGIVDPGDSFDYTIAVTNNGPSNARDVAVADQLPSPLSFVSSTSGCTAAAQDVTCPTVASLAPGETRSSSFTVRLDGGTRVTGPTSAIRAP